MQPSADRVKRGRLATLGEVRRGCNSRSGAAEPFVCYYRLKPSTLWPLLVLFKIKGRGGFPPLVISSKILQKYIVCFVLLNI